MEGGREGGRREGGGLDGGREGGREEGGRRYGWREGGREGDPQTQGADGVPYSGLVLAAAYAASIPYTIIGTVRVAVRGSKIRYTFTPCVGCFTSPGVDTR